MTNSHLHNHNKVLFSVPFRCSNAELQINRYQFLLSHSRISSSLLLVLIYTFFNSCQYILSPSRFYNVFLLILSSFFFFLFAKLTIYTSSKIFFVQRLKVILYNVTHAITNSKEEKITIRIYTIDLLYLKHAKNLCVVTKDIFIITFVHAFFLFLSFTSRNTFFYVNHIKSINRL